MPQKRKFLKNKTKSETLNDNLVILTFSIPKNVRISKK